MNQLLRDYIGWGLCEIYVLNSEWHETGGGSWPDEVTEETVVAKKADRFVKVTARVRIAFGYSAGRWVDRVSESEIGKPEYVRLSAGGERVDSAAVLAQIADEDARESRREQLRSQLQDTAPKCPDCGRSMTSRKSKYGPFWGCVSFPHCAGKMNMSAKAITLYSEWSKC